MDVNIYVWYLGMVGFPIDAKNRRRDGISVNIVSKNGSSPLFPTSTVKLMAGCVDIHP